MPELPEVEGVVRSLQPVVTGKTIYHVTISEVIKQAIEGMTIKSIERRSKYIFFHLRKKGTHICSSTI